ncbi:hypothetical protein BDN72DRAFT_831245 [Pluteus cervinus]|uniref:Uncharacterized protein n=1 Tax=Pluteus cervinus TaxID=181527 RepID=A0ACD3BD06_9AGAR|nr:hypothetical protein BDN72DRAFT_831245 [Pluteus cervinus]
MTRNRLLFLFLSFLAVFLVGTVVVLSSITYYLAIDPSAYLSELEVPILDNVTRWNASSHGQVEYIPRIIHQTWKSDILPPRWKDISQACRDMMPDYYEYMLWTDASSRDFIAAHYPWFLDTYDDYDYVIQRADAIRYFVLHHFGGVYIDLDIGCRKPMDPLLVHHLILPKTIPVGVSNDLMFSEPRHPLLEQAIHNLITFDHSWFLNYPTVMFSTGPMFLSIQYGLYSSHPGSNVRILPKSLYGKNAKPEDAPNSFFAHYYGSSWHSDDAAFVWFLGTWGKGLMWLGLLILVVGFLKIPNRQRRSAFRRIGAYDVLLPRWSHRTGRLHLHLGRSSMPSSGTSTTLPSPTPSTVPSTPIEGEVFRLPFDVQSPSPSMYDSRATDDSDAGRTQSSLTEVFRQVRSRVSSLAGYQETPSRSTISRSRQRRSRGVLFFLPAIFTQSQDIELEAPPHRHHRSRSPPPLLSHSISRSHLPEKFSMDDDSSTSDDCEFSFGSPSARPS